MTEHTLVDAFQSTVRRLLPPPLVMWKIADRFTLDQPDLELAWRGYTTKIEFKYLRKGVGIHEELGVGQQLTCQRYSEATSRCWVVAYTAKNWSATMPGEFTFVYWPPSLFHGAEPSLGLEAAYSLERLWLNGGMLLPGHNHAAIVQLIKDTHQ